MAKTEAQIIVDEGLKAIEENKKFKTFVNNPAQVPALLLAITAAAAIYEGIKERRK